MIRNLVCIGILISCFACNNDDDAVEDPVFCTLEARPGIEVTVKSSMDDPMFVVEGVKVVITDNEYKETLENFTESNTFFGAYERTGVYTVTVSKQEYKTNITNSVVVDKDMCHVITQSIEVLLEKEQ